MTPTLLAIRDNGDQETPSQDRRPGERLYDLTHVLCTQTHEHATHTMDTAMRNRNVTHSAQGIFMILGVVSFI